MVRVARQGFHPYMTSKGNRKDVNRKLRDHYWVATYPARSAYQNANLGRAWAGSRLPVTSPPLADNYGSCESSEPDY